MSQITVTCPKIVNCSLHPKTACYKSGISHTEVWRLETGERKNPSPPVLKSLAPHLGVTYEELMKKAGYLEEVVEHSGYTETVYRDDENKVVDIVRVAKDMYEKTASGQTLPTE